MKKFVVGTVEGAGNQVSIDCESGKIVEGVCETGVVELMSGERVRIEKGRFTGQA